MKTKILSGILASSLVFLTVFFIFNSDNKPDKRTEYEQFLLKSYKSFPSPETDLKQIPKADRPDMAAMQNYYQTIDPELGYVPRKKQYEAYLQTKTMGSTSERSEPIVWEGTSANMGGRTRAMMFDPNDDQHKKVWVAGVTGGIWYTNDITDVNEVWYPVNDFYPNLAISSLASDPNDPMVFYAGTGEAQTARVIYRESTGLGIGIMKSVDGGETWEVIPSTEGFAYVTDVEVRDENGVGVVYAAVVSGTYQGTDHESEPGDGLYRSMDGGLNWEQVLPEIPGESGIYYAPAQIELASNNRLFVGTMENLDKKGGATILYSDEGTAGSWFSYTHYNDLISNEGYYNIPSRTIIAASPSNPDIVYAQFAAGFNNGFTYYRGRYMAKSINGGETWSQINIPDPDWSTLAWHAFDLKVDPTNPAAVFTGGLDLWKTMNSGQSWEHISDWSLMYYGGGDAYVHADQHNILYRPENPTQAIFSSDGGVFLSTNAQLTIPTFVERNQNYNTLQFYSADINPSTTFYQFIGGLQDNGSLKYTGNALDINDMISGGDGAYCFWDQNEPNLYITSVYYNAYYIWKNNSYMDYFDGGNGTFISPADYDYKTNTLFSNAVTFEGNYPGRIYVISGIGSSANEDMIDLETFSTVPFSHIKYSQHSPGGTSTLFVGTQSGMLYKVENAQNSPIVTEIGSDDFPTANLSSVSIGGSEDTLLVTFSNYGVSSIWQTYDGGTTWQEKEGNLPDMPIRWAMYHPQNSGQALLATETGIWTTKMMHTDNPDWFPANEGMGNVRVDMLRLRQNDNMVIAASHGRGVFNGIWNVDVYTGNDEIATKKMNLTVFPNPASNYIQIGSSKMIDENSTMQVFDNNGKVVLEKKVISSNEKIDISQLKNGSYITVLQSDKQIFSGKFVKLVK
ncbi:MAG: T9SS type A sorting domain-containing protein [Bacteroidales bacterium]|nr:T9SS type A sorting domain-containing protein [Bacteroidales bacterium]